MCKVKDDARTIADNLKSEARRAQMLMIWTDCDREGENIGSEIMKICQKANANITVRRARFSAIIAQYVLHARSSSPYRACVVPTDKYTTPHNIPYISIWHKRTLLRPA